MNEVVQQVVFPAMCLNKTSITGPGDEEDEEDDVEFLGHKGGVQKRIGPTPTSAATDNPSAPAFVIMSPPCHECQLAHKNCHKCNILPFPPYVY